MKIPILICIPFWSGDQGEALELCKIIAGLQPGHAGNLAHFMLVNRQDCPMDPNMVKIISAKFNVHTFKSPSPMRGWPAGPNGMFGTTMIHIANQFVKLYEVVYWMEPDCVPIRPNWFWDLVLEWRRKHPKAKVIGCRHDCNGDGTGDHLSGCCLYDPNIARILPCITTSGNVAWDYAHRAKIVAIGAHTNLIQNHYKATTGDPRIIDQQGVSIIHGYKTSFVRDLVKAKFNIR